MKSWKGTISLRERRVKRISAQPTTEMGRRVGSALVRQIIWGLGKVRFVGVGRVVRVRLVKDGSCTARASREGSMEGMTGGMRAWAMTRNAIKTRRARLGEDSEWNIIDEAWKGSEPSYLSELEVCRKSKWPS